MVLGVPARPGRLRHAASLELKIGGAESNVAIALCRLVLDRIRSEGVDSSRVSRLQD
jgi:hypothetical protein